ncbi:hypothetical protein JCM3770_001312 [Rhodotorula araucariae]
MRYYRAPGELDQLDRHGFVDVDQSRALVVVDLKWGRSRLVVPHKRASRVVHHDIGRIFNHDDDHDDAVAE